MAEKNPDLSMRLRAARERAGVTQEELARRLGMSTKGYRAYEAGRHPDQHRLKEIADALEITIPELLIEDGLQSFRRQLAVLQNKCKLLERRVAQLERRDNGPRLHAVDDSGK